MAKLTSLAIRLMLLGLVVAIVYVLFSASGTGGPKVRYSEFANGDMEKLDFSFQGDVHDQNSFFSPKGDPIGFADLKGKILIVNFWANWCAPCKRELPSLANLQRGRGGDQFEVIAINLDLEDAIEDARRDLTKLVGDDLEFYYAPELKISYEAGATLLPTSIVYDVEGREIARLVGDAVWDGYDAVGFVDAMIRDLYQVP